MESVDTGSDGLIRKNGGNFTTFGITKMAYNLIVNIYQIRSSGGMA